MHYHSLAHEFLHEFLPSAPFHFITCITLVPDTYWRLARVGAWKVLACMEYVEMPWYDLFSMV